MLKKTPCTERFPRAFTFVLHLEPPENAKEYLKNGKPPKKGEKNDRKGKAPSFEDFGVKLRAPRAQNSWKGIQKKDVVQFVPDPKDERLKGARVLVKFRAKNLTTVRSPFKVPEIRSTAFYEVVKSPQKFWAQCFLIDANGAQAGYYTTSGRVLCQKPPCQ